MPDPRRRKAVKTMELSADAGRPELPAESSDEVWPRRAREAMLCWENGERTEAQRGELQGLDVGMLRCGAPGGWTTCACRNAV